MTTQTTIENSEESTLDGESSRSSASVQAFDVRNPELEKMMRGLLHELRNPLSSIITAATLLQDSTFPAESEVADESRMLLEVVKKESLRLNHILTEFAGYIKIPVPQPHAFDLASTLRVTIAEMQREGVLPAEVEITDELPETCDVWADESQVRDALRHLLHNAGEAMPGGGKLILSLAPSNSQNGAAICLGDSGRGLTSESRERAFQPFYSTKEHNLGLGLPAVKSIFEAAEGRVWIEDDAPNSKRARSTPDGAASSGGVRVCFELPRAS